LMAAPAGYQTVAWPVLFEEQVRGRGFPLRKKTGEKQGISGG